MITVRRFDSTGAPLGGEIPVSTSVWPVHAAADVAMDPSGGFVVSWAVGDLTAQGAVLARVYDAQGQPRSPEITVSEGIDAIGGTRIASDPRGGFLVAWSDLAADQTLDVYARSFDASWQPRGEAFTLNTFPTLTQMQPALASSPAGHFFAAWASGQVPPPYDDGLKTDRTSLGRRRDFMKLDSIV